jgi:hypothetical protein
MNLSRPLFLSLLIVFCVATLAAQSSQDKPPAFSQSRSEIKDDAPLDSARQHIVTLEQNDLACYTVRAYRVARISPDSDTTRPAGYSTCQRASRFQFRTAVDSREITPR